MQSVALEQRNRIHPHMFALWVAIGSMIMMFAGLTSAVIVKKSQADWVGVEIPMVFYVSTVVMLMSSFLMYRANIAFVKREMLSYRFLIIGTLFLGLIFIVLQVVGFNQYWKSGITLNNSPVSYQLLYVVVSLHAIHVIGGVVALIVMASRAFSQNLKYYGKTPLELASTYWHFVDILWIYLFVFLILVNK